MVAFHGFCGMTAEVLEVWGGVVIGIGVLK